MWCLTEERTVRSSRSRSHDQDEKLNENVCLVKTEETKTPECRAVRSRERSAGIRVEGEIQAHFKTPPSGTQTNWAPPAVSPPLHILISPREKPPSSKH